MLHANDIAPRDPEPPEPQALDAVTPPTTSETSSGEAKHLEVKKEVESGFETDDEDSMREKALLVRFRFHVVNF